MTSKEAALHKMLTPIVTGLGFTLWGIEFLAQGRRSVLRIYIDHESGIGVDDCAKVSHQASALLDVEDPISGEYVLEVSSPGMDRPLYTPEQFQAYVGAIVKLRLRMPFDGRRKFVGRLNAIENDEVVLQVDDAEYLLPFELIDKANVVPEF
ncbi:ribosome maturation protein RimP [Pokkaliibacter plantistimulans]|uniref:Ribosome maturation factor RimP n=1 Tax=Pokkaliibacter plantistimulans TaxID=1635171 RepID=A0ABX5LU13_9GAMM|nr:MULTISPECIES: ribosome maturation factor RimP [Pokkaliibacter]MDH2434147.1 ribosome maturation factor RimP [Pokkaliibacter sp. MBI-7]PXF30154.1 ribosome maturation protein RimP [Pokkaliibacter plantistimulans]